MTIWRRGKPDALPHHSDQSSQYTSDKFQPLMADNGVTFSMSRPGNVWDNAAMEAGKLLLVARNRTNPQKPYHTRSEARANAFD
jgi:putative transposase